MNLAVDVIAVKAFELLQSLREKWLTADYAAKRRILGIVCLNCSLDDENLCATMRKPFDEFAKRLVLDNSRPASDQFKPLLCHCVDGIVNVDAYLHGVQRLASIHGHRQLAFTT